jgi:hypothetical protein
MVTLLAELLPVKALLKWAVRLIVLGVVLLLTLALVLGIVLLLWNNPAPYHPRTWTINIATLYLGWKLFRAWLRRRRVPVVGPRTINGKVVPDTLAVAALSVPAHSPDGDSVLRALPDYGKALLKLDPNAYAYVPDIEPEASEESQPEPTPKPPFAAVIRGWLGRVPRPVTAVVAALILVAVVVATRAPWRSESASGRSVAPIVEGQTAHTDPAPIAASNPPSIAEITASIGAGGGQSPPPAATTERSTQQPVDTSMLMETAEIHLNKALAKLDEGVVDSQDLTQALAAFETADDYGAKGAHYRVALIRAECNDIPCDGWTRDKNNAVTWYQTVMNEAPRDSDSYRRAATALGATKMN